jgi:glutathione S-transferase
LPSSHRPPPSCRRCNPPGCDMISTAVIDTNIVLYQAEWCPYCAHVRRELTDLLLDYKVVNEPEDHGARTNLKELFGTTGIPSMTDGDVKIADDDDAIIEYLRKTYGKKR